LYSNAKTARHLILEDNQNKSGVYLWYNNATGKYYIGQAKDLGDRKQGRLNRYYRPSYLRSKARGSSAIRAAFFLFGFIFYLKVNNQKDKVRSRVFLSLYIRILFNRKTRRKGTVLNRSFKAFVQHIEYS